MAVTGNRETKDHSDGELPSIERLDAFIGEWGMEARFPGGPPGGPVGRTVFEWLPGRRFLAQCWEVPDPAAPDGIAIIGCTEGGDTYFQHYYDSRGVARIYSMTFEDGVWKLLRDAPDFSPLDFCQRFTAEFSADGTAILGDWESSQDGTSWEHDFRLNYTRIR